jgi:hypothetical protein
MAADEEQLDRERCSTENMCLISKVIDKEDQVIVPIVDAGLKLSNKREYRR